MLLEDNSPQVSGAAAVHLLAVVQGCRGHPLLGPYLLDIQAAFTRKLTVRLATIPCSHGCDGVVSGAVEHGDDVRYQRRDVSRLRASGGIYLFYLNGSIEAVTVMTD